MSAVVSVPISGATPSVGYTAANKIASKREPPRPIISGAAALGGCQKIVPDRLLAESRDKGPMRVAVGFGDTRRKRNGSLPPRYLAGDPVTNLLAFSRQD